MTALAIDLVLTTVALVFGLTGPKDQATVQPHPQHKD